MPVIDIPEAAPAVKADYAEPPLFAEPAVPAPRMQSASHVAGIPS
jgi:hypothetical protein